MPESEREPERDNEREGKGMSERGAREQELEISEIGHSACVNRGSNKP